MEMDEWMVMKWILKYIDNTYILRNQRRSLPKAERAELVISENADLVHVDIGNLGNSTKQHSHVLTEEWFIDVRDEQAGRVVNDRAEEQEVGLLYVNLSTYRWNMR